jgi:hypothetical protein
LLKVVAEVANKMGLEKKSVAMAAISRGFYHYQLLATE